MIFAKDDLFEVLDIQNAYILTATLDAIDELQTIETLCSCLVLVVMSLP